MPASSANQPRATSGSSVQGAANTVGPVGTSSKEPGAASHPIAEASVASRARRSASGTSASPSSPSHNRSNTIKVAGISPASLRTRDSAGCSRSCSSSKSIRPGATRTISASATNGPWLASRSSSSSNSGKYRPRDLPSRLARRAVPSVSIATIVRNPSHFGS